MTDNQWEFENGTNQGKVKAKLCLNGCQLWKLMVKIWTNPNVGLKM